MDYERLWNQLLVKLYDLDRNGNIIQHTYASMCIEMMRGLEQGAKNTEQQLQPENGPVKCANNGCAGWDNGFCAMPGLCREGAVSG